MWSKLLAYFQRNPLDKVQVVSAQSLSISINDFLVITVEPCTDMSLLRKFEQHCREFFKTENVLVVAGDDVRFLKVAIEEKMVDDIMLKEEVTRWKN